MRLWVPRGGVRVTSAALVDGPELSREQPRRPAWRRSFTRRRASGRSRREPLRSVAAAHPQVPHSSSRTLVIHRSTWRCDSSTGRSCWIWRERVPNILVLLSGLAMCSALFHTTHRSTGWSCPSAGRGVPDRSADDVAKRSNYRLVRQAAIRPTTVAKAHPLGARSGHRWTVSTGARSRRSATATARESLVPMSGATCSGVPETAQRRSCEGIVRVAKPDDRRCLPSRRRAASARTRGDPTRRGMSFSTTRRSSTGPVHSSIGQEGVAVGTMARCARET